MYEFLIPARMKYCTCMQLAIMPLFLTATSCQMLNFTVYSKTNRKMLVPWRIHGVNPPDVTFRGFYYQEGTRSIEGGSHSTQLELHCTYVGSSKDRLDLVDSNLKVLEVTSVFGPYAKFLVEEISGGESMDIENGERYNYGNVFSAYVHVCQSLPSTIAEPRNIVTRSSSCEMTSFPSFLTKDSSGMQVK